MKALQSLRNAFEKDYPYVNARVSAMSTKLLESNDYSNLLKMKPNEIARKLEEGEYEEEINELGSQLEGVPLLESALELNAARTLNELVEMCPESLAEVLEVYIRRYELESLKRILRWKKSGEKEDHKPDLIPGMTYSLEDLEELTEKSFEEIVASISFEGFVNYQDYVDTGMDINSVEKSLDQAYFDELQALAERTGSREFSRFIRDELEYENLRIILRLKKYGVEDSEIEEKLFENGRSDFIQEAIRAEDIEEIEEVLEGSRWSIDSGDEVEEIENSLEIQRLEKARRDLRSTPLGVVPVIAYVAAKMIEVNNLSQMIRAKSTGIQSNEEIRENLVIMNE